MKIPKSLEVNKPGNPLNDYQVDGISGGTSVMLKK